MYRYRTIRALKITLNLPQWCHKLVYNVLKKVYKYKIKDSSDACSFLLEISSFFHFSDVSTTESNAAPTEFAPFEMTLTEQKFLSEATHYLNNLPLLDQCNLLVCFFISGLIIASKMRKILGRIL